MHKHCTKADLSLHCDWSVFFVMLSVEKDQQYSYSAPPMEQAETYIQTDGDSEFLKAVDGRKADKVWKLIDELVEAVKILHPRMYTTFIDKVQDL